MVTHVAIHYILQESIMNTIADMAVAYQAEDNPRLPTLRAQLRDVNKRIGNLVSAIEEGVASATTRQRLDELEQQRTGLETSICQEEMKHPELAKDQILQWLQQIKNLDLDDLRVQRQVVDCFVNSIYLFDEKLIINFNFGDETRQVTLQEVQEMIKTKENEKKQIARCLNLIFYVDGFGVVFYNED